MWAAVSLVLIVCFSSAPCLGSTIIINGITFSTDTTASFSPKSTMELKQAVNSCLQESKSGDCSKDHGPIGKWDVSHVTDMTQMFEGARSFNQDLSKWDVSHVTNMASMFESATSFNQDVSRWDVSRVTDMSSMFHGAPSFNQQLCGFAWVHSKASKTDMFKDSPGSISKTVCSTSTISTNSGTIATTAATSTSTAMAVFSPKTTIELKHAVNSCLQESKSGDCSKDHGPIGEWDVSQVTDMNYVFERAGSFNQDLSKWDVSRVTDMKWMFGNASAFQQTLCGVAWVDSNATKTNMFTGSPGSISNAVCGVFSPQSRHGLKRAVDDCLLHPG